jgi:hypothetical protein
MGWIFAGFLMVLVVESVIRICRDYEPEHEKPRRKARR